MGYLINDESYLNGNIFKYEERLSSQYAQFLDKSPTFVTYYHINNIESIVDSGLLNVDEIVGKNSPIKFQQINDFPIIGIESLQPNLAEEDEGLNSSLESEGVILPNTIVPFPNDFFTISYLGREFMFMVSEVAYDVIKSNNFYKINFFLKHTEGDNEIQEQVSEKYSCIYGNVGTQDKCIIREEEYLIIEKIRSIFVDIRTKYLTLFYSKKFNSFIYDNGNGTILYDKYASHFINKEELYLATDEYTSIVLSNEDHSPRFIGEFDSSIYQIIMDKDKDSLEYCRYLTTKIIDTNSIFKYYSMDNVYSIVFTDSGNTDYLPQKLIDDTKSNKIDKTTKLFDKLFIDYFNDNIESVYSVNIDDLSKIKIKYTLEDFRNTPIMLYILCYYARQFSAL